MSKNETYRYHYRFGLVSENMWNAEQYLASATSKVSDPEDNSWLEIQPDKYHNRPYVLEVMSKGECFGRLGQISKMDKKIVSKLIAHPRKNPYSLAVDKKALRKDYHIFIIISSDMKILRNEDKMTAVDEILQIYETLTINQKQLVLHELLEIAKKETDYDRKMWLQDTAQGQWKSLYRNIVLYIRGKVRNQTRDNLLESLDYNYRAVLFLFAVEGKILCVYSGNSSIIPILEQQKYLSDFQYWNNTDRPEEISEKDWEKRYHLWEKAIGPEYFLPDHGFMVNLYDTSMELFRTNFPFYKESVPDYDDILYRLMNTLYPDIEGDQWEDKWNELKRNCPKMDMDGIGQIFDLTERRS